MDTCWPWLGRVQNWLQRYPILWKAKSQFRMRTNQLTKLGVVRGRSLCSLGKYCLKSAKIHVLRESFQGSMMKCDWRPEWPYHKHIQIQYLHKSLTRKKDSQDNSREMKKHTHSVLKNERRPNTLSVFKIEYTDHYNLFNKSHYNQREKEMEA